jgi:hypothetical protein
LYKYKHYDNSHRNPSNIDTEFPKDVTLDNEQVSLLLKQANQSSLGDQFGTILTIMASGLKINNKIRLEILKYEYNSCTSNES